MKKKLTFIVTLAMLTSPLAVKADDRMAKNHEESARASMGETKDQTRFRTLVNNASEAYGAITKGVQGEVPESVLKNVLCIGVLPSVMTGAFVVGGTHGEGLVSCKNDSTWSQPATISLNQGSIGLQAGAKSADIVLFFQTKEAVQALKRGNFSLGSDVSAVAGTYDSNANLDNAGVLVYTRSEGLYAGASMTGSKLGKDQDMLERYYGKKIDYSALLDGRESPDSKGETQKFTQLLPQS